MTEDEYSAILQKQEEHLIKIKRQVIVQKGTLRYIPLLDRLDSRRERDIFLPAGKEQSVHFLYESEWYEIQIKDSKVLDMLDMSYDIVAEQEKWKTNKG